MASPKEPAQWDIRSRIALLRRQDTMSDVTIRVGEPLQKFHCHKLILGAGSEVFQAMFYGDIPEKAEVHVPDVTPEGFEIMLEYLYCDNITIKSVSDAFEGAYAAKKYLIHQLFDHCENYLMINIKLSADNVCTTFEQASFLEMQPLKIRCERFICRNFQAISLSKSFTSVSKSVLEEILMMDLLEVTSECDVINALLCWGDAQCWTSELKTTRKNMRTFVGDLLKHVRFLTITVTQFENLMDKYDFLEPSEEMAILLNMALPRNEKFLKMPPGFSSSTQQRSGTGYSRIRIPLEYRYNNCKDTFTITKYKQSANIKIIHGQAIIVGAVFAIKPIAGYLRSHRYLNIDFLVQNISTKAKSTSKTCIKPKVDNDESTHELYLEDPLFFAEEQAVDLTVWLEGEGVQLPLFIHEHIITKYPDGPEITMKLSEHPVGEKQFVIKEILIA